MVKRNILLVLTLVMMTGCDPVYGPPWVRNEFDTNVEISIVFADGDTNQLVLPSCVALALGEIGNRSKINVGVKQILISKAGRIIHNLDMVQAQVLIDKQKKHIGYSVLSIGPEGFQLITDPKSKSCSEKVQEN